MIKLGDQPSKPVQMCSPKLDQLATDAMQRQHRQLMLCFDSNCLARLLDCRPDRPHVSNIALVAANERLNCHGRK